MAAAGMVSCSSTYSRSADGLVIVPSTGSAVVQAFSFNLSSGSSSTINTSPPISGNPLGVVIDPAGAYAYIATGAGISAFSIHSDGTLSAVGSVTANAVAMTMDTAGKFLFVASGLSGTVSSFSISNGALTPVSTSPTLTAATLPNLAALAVTPLSFPAMNTASGALNSVCAGLPNPANEYLYAVDSQNNVVWQFNVDSSGNLTQPSSAQSFATGQVPAGIAVDSCDRFVYVSNSRIPTISAYAICNDSIASPCPNPVTTPQDGHLVPLATTSLGAGASQPGAVVVDPLARYLYVADSAANKLFGFRLSQATGTLTSFVAVNTDSVPVSVAIRSDAMWMFVTNYGSGTVSEFAIAPATGTLTQEAPITTDNNPYGVAVK